MSSTPTAAGATTGSGSGSGSGASSTACSVAKAVNVVAAGGVAGCGSGSGAGSAGSASATTSATGSGTTSGPTSGSTSGSGTTSGSGATGANRAGADGSGSGCELDRRLGRRPARTGRVPTAPALARRLGDDRLDRSEQGGCDRFGRELDRRLDDRLGSRLPGQSRARHRPRAARPPAARRHRRSCSADPGVCRCHVDRTRGRRWPAGRLHRPRGQPPRPGGPLRPPQVRMRPERRLRLRPPRQRIQAQSAQRSRPQRSQDLSGLNLSGSLSLERSQPQRSQPQPRCWERPRWRSR